MARLPDVPIDVWTGYIQDQFTEKTNGLMDALEFRIKTSPFGEMFPAVSPQDNPMLSTYEQQLKQDADEQERRRNEEMQRLQQEQEFLTLRQEQAALMQRLAPPEPTPLDPGPPAQPGNPYPDTQDNPDVHDLFYRGAPPTDGEVPGVTYPLYKGPDQTPPDTMFKETSAQPQPQQVPPPMFEAPTPVQGQSFSDYAGQLRQMLGGERNSSYAAPPEPAPIEQNPVAPAEPTPVGADETQAPQGGLRNFQETFNQEFEQPQDRPQDPVSSKFWEPVTNVTEKMASKSHEIGLGDAWAAATAATDPAEKANLTRIAIGKTLQMVPDAVSEAAASPLIAAMGERETNPLAKANPLATGRVGDLPGAEAIPAAQLLRDAEIPGLKGVGSAIGVEDDARYLPTDIAVNVANGPGRALEIAQWLGVAGQALEHPDSPATAMLGIPAAGLAARYGLKGLGRLADSSIDPLDAIRTSAVADNATPSTAGDFNNANMPDIFSEPVENIRNTATDITDGLVPGNIPDTALANTTKYGMSAAQGALSGGLAAAEEDDADLGDISRGAALGAARGLGGRALRGTGAQGAWSSNIAKSEWKASWKPLYADQPRTPIENRPETIQGKAWEKFGQARDYLSERFFDNRTYVNKLQSEARRYLGRDLTYDEMLSEHTRRNTSQAAQVAIDQMLRPAVQRVGPDIDYFKDAMTYRDNIAVSNAKARQVYAQEAARQTPQVQAAEREVRRLEKMQNSPNAPMDLHTRLDEARTRLDEEIGIREGEAWQTGGMAGEGRSFSGDVDVRESQRRLAEIEQVVGPERWANIQSAMDDTQKFVEEYRQRMYDHGIINKKTLDALQQYDFYIPTRILDHINDESKVAVGGSVSLRDTGIHEASIKGTTAEREDPINSLMRLAFDSEARIAKNDAFNAFHALNAETPIFRAKRVEGTDARAKLTDEGSRSRIVTGFVDGKKLAYEVSDPWTAKALRFESDPVSNRFELRALRKLASVSREMITRNPAFIAGQVLLDVSGALVRESAWEGGPQNVPKVLKSLMQTYFDPELWKGLDSGQYKGDYARFLREGGGMAGFQDMTQEGLLRKQGDLQRNNPLDGFQVNNKEDWGRVVKWLGTGEALQNISTRLDLAPRVAAARLAEERLAKQGVDPNSAKLRGMIAGRESTMDFSKGGSLTKMLNQFIPFFNIGFQSAATPVRALRENPVAFPATAAATIGVPIMAAEAWNRSDPQRARDYEDIPDYIKARNLIVMMPEVPGTDIGKAGVDEFGGRRPKYIQFPLREFAMFGVLGRAAAQKAIQEAGGDVRDPMSWHQLGQELLVTGSPLTANNPTDLTTSFAPVGLSSALQLANNKDAFRGRQIATERNDMEASNISKALSNGLFDKFGVEIRPSQLEFLVRDSMSYTGAGALAAGDALTGRTRLTQEGAQSAPVVGGAVKRFYGNATGTRVNRSPGKSTDWRYRQDPATVWASL
jgi:hypothetical protein